MGDRGRLTVGSVVEARHGGGPKFYKADHRDVERRAERLCVEYDDGGRESDVPRLRVRLPGQKQRQELPAGTRVDAGFGGGKELYPAEVTARGTPDGTYDLRYDDGDEERGVTRPNIFADYHWPDPTPTDDDESEAKGVSPRPAPRRERSPDDSGRGARARPRASARARPRVSARSDSSERRAPALERP